MAGSALEPGSDRMHFHQAFTCHRKRLCIGLSAMSHGHVRAVSFQQRMAWRPTGDGFQTRMQRLPRRRYARARPGRLPARMLGLQTVPVFVSADPPAVKPVQHQGRRSEAVALATSSGIVLALPGIVPSAKALFAHRGRRFFAGGFCLAKRCLLQLSGRTQDCGPISPASEDTSFGTDELLLIVLAPWGRELFTGRRGAHPSQSDEGGE